MQDVAARGKCKAVKSMQCWWDWARRLSRWECAVEMEGRGMWSANPPASADRSGGRRCCNCVAVSVPSEGGLGSDMQQHVGM